MRRFFCSDIPEAGQSVQLDAAEARHLATVLRAEAGEQIILLDGQGTVAEARLSEVNRRKSLALCEVTSKTMHPQASPSLHLYIAPPRGKLMPQIVRQLTELGVASIHPIFCARSESRPKAGATESWEQSAREACKQAINPWCPVIHTCVTFKEALDEGTPSGWVGATPGRAASRASAIPQNAEELALWVGPEGGFTDDELDTLLAAGLQPLQVGDYTLRIGTAAVAGIAAIRTMQASHHA